MTIEDDLNLLKQKAAEVVNNAEDDTKVFAQNALVHVLRGFAYTGLSHLGAVEHLVTRSGSYLSELDYEAGLALAEFGNLAFNIVEAEAVDKLLIEQGIEKSNLPEDLSIYEQFRSGHTEKSSIVLWLIS